MRSAQTNGKFLDLDADFTTVYLLVELQQDDESVTEAKQVDLTPPAG